MLVGSWAIDKTADDISFTERFNADGTYTSMPSGNGLKGLAIYAMVRITGPIRGQWSVSNMKIKMTYEGGGNEEFNAFSKLMDTLTGENHIGSAMSLSVARFDENRIVFSHGVVMRRLGASPR